MSPTGNGSAVSKPVREEENVRLTRAVEEYLAALEAGRKPDRREFLERHADIAGPLAECLGGLEFVKAAAVELHSQAGSDSAPAASPLGESLGDFRILREVGRGGMGVVYEAEQMSLRRRVALKVLPFAATMDPRHLRRFQNEAQAAACLHHTNIVPVYSVGCERGIHFYAMQFIDGQPLSELIRQLALCTTTAEERSRAYQPADETVAASPTVGTASDVTFLTREGKRGREYFRRVAELGVQAAEALDHAHQLGVVHRDIKPANLLLDGRGNLWVTDFGLAQYQGDARLTRTGDLVGTLRYMSPEQALAQRRIVDHRTDVYSLGATLYELLTLRPAFAGEDRQELLRQIAFEEPPPPRRLNKAIPAELETIVLKMMAKDPGERYATAQELAHDLRNFLEDRPIRARRPPLLKRLGRWGRRHKPLVAATAAVGIALGVLVGGVQWVAHDHIVRRAEQDRVVGAALEESLSWQEQRRLPEALSAARRAAGLLAGGIADEALHRRVRARLDDLELLDRLENILLEGATVKDDHFDSERADTLYGETFRAVGLDFESLSPDEIGARMRASTVPAELAAALDEWAMVRLAVRGRTDTTWRDFMRAARAADPDAWRNRVREAHEGKDRPALLELSASPEAFRLLHPSLRFLARILSYIGAPEQAETLLRETRRRNPHDFWCNHELAAFLRNQGRFPQVQESIRFFTAAVAIRPQSPGAHVNLGSVLHRVGELDAAVGEYREAIRLKKDYAMAHCNLGKALVEKGLLDEGLSECREAVRLRKDSAHAHTSLANALRAKGLLDKSIAEYREALRIDKDDPWGHLNLGDILRDRGSLDEAIAEYREAIRIKKEFPQAHCNLGALLCDQKHDYDGAIAEFREAIRLNKDYASAHYNLGNALSQKGRLDEAIAEYRQTILLRKDDAEAHCNLGAALREQGLFRQSAEEFRQGHELGSREPHWPYPSTEWLRDAERLAELDDKLLAILAGQKRPQDTGERIALASFCQHHKKLYAAAARFYTEAFAADPRLADDLGARHRYNAACSAARAGWDHGKDAEGRDEQESVRLRRQALDWLRADLKAWRRALDKAPEKAGPETARCMRHWLRDDDFAGVRGPDALSRLPQAERSEWQNLWEEVEALRRRAASPARP